MKKMEKIAKKQKRKLRKRSFLLREFYKTLLNFESTIENAESVVDQWQRIMRRFKFFPSSRFDVIDGIVQKLENETSDVLIAFRFSEIKKAFQPCFQ